MKLNSWTKTLLVFLLISITVIGFMVKLPSSFRHIDKELHSAFYFFAAAFLNLLFAKRKLLKHIFIFVCLYLFGVAIEYAQEYSNKFLGRRIHGRFDVEDVQANLKGLLFFSILWIIVVFIMWIYEKSRMGSIKGSRD